jgi:hypothetical protein
MRKQKIVIAAGISTISLMLLVTGCAKTSNPTSAPIATPTPTPTASATPTATLTSAPKVSPSTSGSRAMALYWVADTALGFRLYREFARLDVRPNPMAAALRALVTTKPKDSDYTNLWPTGTKINSVKVSGTLATVDLTMGKMNVGSEAEALAIAQLVWTATAADPTVTKISLTLDGKKVESLAGHVDATKPFVRAPTYNVLAPVWITSPAEGEQKLAQGFKLSGMASTFEANVAWKVYFDGKLIRKGSTTASQAAPAWKPWSVAISGLAPGRYLFAAMEYSAKDGSIVSKDTKNVTLK